MSCIRSRHFVRLRGKLPFQLEVAAEPKACVAAPSARRSTCRAAASTFCSATPYIDDTVLCTSACKPQHARIRLQVPWAVHYCVSTGLSARAHWLDLESSCLNGGGPFYGAINGILHCLHGIMIAIRSQHHESSALPHIGRLHPAHRSVARLHRCSHLPRAGMH